MVFFTTLLASVHCVGMCGGLALACSLDNDPEAAGAWRRFRLPLFYSMGRLGTYLTLGAASGWLGSLLVTIIRPSAWFGIPHLVVGVIMIVMGLESCGLFALRPAVADGWLARRLRLAAGASRTRRVLGMGILTGFLPCGMHWAFQAKAFETGSALGGVAVLTAFGLGTLPAMLGFGMLATWLDQRARGRILFVAGMLIILMGVISLRRGMALMPW
ncbi:MAG: sulfite exporter TauE/SafE family protein [Magnetococcales bacterium]|nr:sulfite exporter TauE/SafE family protein [Magnetococcales bacterium]